MVEEFNMVLAGVGGQGILLASQILGIAALKEGLNVVVSEIHGMAQRGGAVVSHVRMGSKVYAPTVMDGKADAILGLEPLEALRNIKYASTETLVLVSTETLVPAGVSAEPINYPRLETILDAIKGFTEKIVLVDALKLAREAGSVITRNVVMLGALAATKILPLKSEALKETIKELVRPAYLNQNLKAFDLGLNEISKLF